MREFMAAHAALAPQDLSGELHRLGWTVEEWDAGAKVRTRRRSPPRGTGGPGARARSLSLVLFAALKPTTPHFRLLVACRRPLKVTGGW